MLDSILNQYLLDHQRIFDAGDDFQAAAADTMRFDADIEYPLQALCPVHRCMACNRCRVFWPGRFGLVTSAAPQYTVFSSAHTTISVDPPK